MRRFAFNGGLMAPAMDCRPDVDGYHRGCRVLTNFDVSTLGGISRRRGMRRLAAAYEKESRLLPFHYAETVNYLVEVSGTKLRVLDTAARPVVQDGAPVEFPLAVGDLAGLRFTQRNAWLILTGDTMPPTLLKVDDAGRWSLEPYKFEHVPWNTTDERDEAVTMQQTADGYSVRLAAGEPAMDGDLLRVSFWTGTQEAQLDGKTAREGIRAVAPAAAGEMSHLTAAMPAFAVGDRVALVEEVAFQNWIFSGTSQLDVQDIVPGLDQPAYYTNKFTQAPGSKGFDSVTPHWKLPRVTYQPNTGTKVKIATGYWHLYTCIKAFNPAVDLVEGKVSPADYPSHFLSGIPMGEALPCRGTWKFMCSGTWYGAYEVRRNAKTAALNGEWETRGTSFSPVGAPMNNLLAGDEQEECYMRLFLTRVRCMGDDIADAWPPDTCENKLAVASYKHDMLLRCHVAGDEGALTISYTREDTIAPEWAGEVVSYDWSWAAFSKRFGFPRVAAVYGNRLVFAGTREQPQTLWISRADDLTNFLRGDTDAAAIQLTMNTASQAPICWLLAKDNRLYVGTDSAEWSVATGNAAAITPANARLESHGHVGAAYMPAIPATDKVLFVERGAGRVWEFAYNYEVQSYQSKDLTVFADHIGAEHGGFTEGSFIRKPDARAVFVLGDGRMALMTYNSMHEVNAWCLYETQEGDRVEHCTVLPQGERQDALYVLTARRKLNTQTGLYEVTRWIEVMDAESEYADGDGLDYTSTMLTNALDDPNRPVLQQKKGEILVRFGSGTPWAGIEVSCDGVVWSKPDRHGDTPTNWDALPSMADWDYERLVGIRVRGNRGLRVLAISS